MTPDNHLGQRLGRFVLIKKIGAGAMGSVYLARDLEQGRQVAIKLLHARLALDGAAVERFRAEARVAQLMRDPHIAQVHEIHSTGDGRHFMVMELLEGVPLSDRTGRPLGAAVAVPILRQLCAAMQVAHQHGVVHRDLKPEHIFLCARPGEPDFVKVLDFGIAKVLQRPANASSRLIWGTPQYMAPEQCGGGRVDNRTDLYAIGVIAYELVTGRVPFDGRNLVEVMVRQRDEKPVPPYELEPSVPEALSAVILRALAKRPDERFATAAEMNEALLRVRTRDGQIPELQAEVRVRGGRPVMEARCTQLLSGGAFLATHETTPPIGEPLCVVLHCDGFPIELPCEVSMHVGSSQAAAWGTPQGFAVRFGVLEPKVQGLLERLLRGDPLPRHTADPEVTRLLKDHRRRNGVEDLYSLLAAPTGADFPAIKRRVRDCRARLEDALLCSNELAGRAVLQRAIDRVEEARAVLSDPSRRVEYDAQRGNFRGVAMCLDAGLSNVELETRRARYRDANPTALAAASVHVAAADRHEAAGLLAEALADCELALTLDPLDGALHLKRNALMAAIEAAAGMTISGGYPTYRRASAAAIV